MIDSSFPNLEIPTKYLLAAAIEKALQNPDGIAKFGEEELCDAIDLDYNIYMDTENNCKFLYNKLICNQLMKLKSQIKNNGKMFCPLLSSVCYEQGTSLVLTFNKAPLDFFVAEMQNSNIQNDIEDSKDEDKKEKAKSEKLIDPSM